MFAINLLPHLANFGGLLAGFCQNLFAFLKTLSDLLNGLLHRLLVLLAAARANLHTAAASALSHRRRNVDQHQQDGDCQLPKV